MHTLTKTIEDSPDLDSVLKPTILSYQDELNQINNQIYQLEQDKQAEAPHYDADMIAKCTTSNIQRYRQIREISVEITISNNHRSH